MSGRGSQLKTQLRPVAAGIRGGLSTAKHGYTIVEVMIFLAITSMLLVMVLVTFSGRQAAAEFSTATREMESRLQDIANDVSTGSFSNPGTFTCTTPSGTPVINPGASVQGTNEDCIFIGKVAQFAVTGNDRQYNVFTVVGSRLGADGEDADDLEDASPTPLVLPGLIDSSQFPVGLVSHSMWAVNGGVRTPISAVGFFTTFGQGVGGSQSSLTVNLIPLGDGDDDAGAIATAIGNISNTSPMNPDGGILVCMDGNATDQHVIVELGGGSSRLTTDLTIEDGTCSEAGF